MSAAADYPADTAVSNEEKQLQKTPGRRGAHSKIKLSPRELRRLYGQLSAGQIAQNYGVTKKTVTEWLKRAGITLRTPHEAASLHAEKKGEFVLPEDRDDCLLDMAWEARPEQRIKYKRIERKVPCRLCFRLVWGLTRGTHNRGHLQRRHDKTGREYSRMFTGARHDSFQCQAESNRTRGGEGDVEKLIKNFAANYATPDELRQWRANPKLAQSQHWIGCLECGRKLFGGAVVQHHLVAGHHWNKDNALKPYRAKWPNAPYQSLDRRAMLTAHARGRYQRDRKFVLKGWRPDGWERWDSEQKAIGIILIENPGIKPRALGILLDQSRLPCIWQQNAGSWERNFAKPGTGRNWLDRLTKRLEGNPLLTK